MQEVKRPGSAMPRYFIYFSWNVASLSMRCHTSTFASLYAILYVASCDIVNVTVPVHGLWSLVQKGPLGGQKVTPKTNTKACIRA